MTKLRELYRCEICGNVVEIAHEGAPALVCCEQPMNKLEGKTEDEGHEKHVPIIVENPECSCGCDEDICVKVQVGGTEHPMEDKHYIKFIEILTADKVLRAELKPGTRPRAEFCVNKEDIIEIREFCTVHMLWKK
ncbi:MAG: desulfoferrodoxin FeS4 iron-binding domain-containing protein [Candidatus Omnitrophica bacterium]|nr:desulfoferrodoxin FeS4 iron-binding domain-containing protein [Candidatus Omnitrophota bacterium]MBU1656830.1 desulfoferrodoxin FeS4 iron-binding domain-containing protein [Candidatus Omnitrophota bacterium]MBU1851428.1 desulfoferrodoxin FeS4 iron-binding domain-containing protein [Candidatus Omnitrophota bacterium]